MRAKMASIYGKKDIRIREVELPEIKDDEILVRVVSNGICYSTYKAALKGEEHLRIPDDVSQNPTVTGHEFAGVIERVGEKWKDKYPVGAACALQAGIRYKGSEDAPGYSFPYFGGNTTHTIIPGGYIESNCLILFDDDYFAYASLGEPVSCTISGFHTMFHDYLTDFFIYDHIHDTKENGRLLLMAACGPMGISAADYAVHRDRKPSQLVVMDINETRMERARSLVTCEEAQKNGVQLTYLNTSGKDAQKLLMELTDGKGFDDIIIFAPYPELVELASDVLGYNGCVNFFAGPMDEDLKAKVNFYDVHYRRTHYVGNSGANLDDIMEMLSMTKAGRLTPEYMITHVTGLDAVPEIILNLPGIPGGKKLVYPHVGMPLMAMEDFEKHPEDPTFRKIGEILKSNNYVWCREAEKILLQEKTID